MEASRAAIDIMRAIAMRAAEAISASWKPSATACATSHMEVVLTAAMLVEQGIEEKVAAKAAAAVVEAGLFGLPPIHEQMGDCAGHASAGNPPVHVRWRLFYDGRADEVRGAIDWITDPRETT